MEIVRLKVGLIGTNCYIVYEKGSDKAFLIDPGDSASRILRELDERKLKAEYIILTHAHFDHVLGVYDLLDMTDAKLCAHALEKERLRDPEISGHKYFHARRHKALVPDIVLNDGDELSAGGLSAKILHTPGHSEGSICAILGGAIFSGDTLFKENCGRCDLIGGDYGEMLRSLKKLNNLKGDYEIYPGHGEASTLEYERKNNPYMSEASGA
ncbi:MAG: MBL fold metallo-hydrolase [Clostridiales bacterium]|nr:MBL fold metallo-hydrolase [Clostridiales bacterium]